MSFTEKWNWSIIFRQVREALGHLHFIAGFTDNFGKFAALRNPLVADLRLTYQFNEGAFPKGELAEGSTGNRHPFSRGWWLSNNSSEVVVEEIAKYLLLVTRETLKVLCQLTQK